MRNHSIILNKLWQYTGGCTIREKPYIIRERDLIMFSLFYFSDSAPQFILCAVAIILFFCFFRHFFFSLTRATQPIVTMISHIIQQMASHLLHMNGLSACQLSVTAVPWPWRVISSLWGECLESDPPLAIHTLLRKLDYLRLAQLRGPHHWNAECAVFGFILQDCHSWPQFSIEGMSLNHNASSLVLNLFRNKLFLIQLCWSCLSLYWVSIL